MADNGSNTAEVTCTTLDCWQSCFKDASPNLSTLRRAFTLLARWPFLNQSNMGEFADALGCYVYDPNSPTNKISITAGSTIDPGDSENVPGIVVSLGDNGVTYTHPTLNSTSFMSSDTSVINRTATAEVDLTFLFRDRSSDVCCQMADLMAMFLFAMYDRLFETWRWLAKYELKQQTEPKLTTKGEDTSNKWYECTLVFSLAYNYTVMVARESKRLKDFTLDTTVRPSRGVIDTTN